MAEIVMLELHELPTEYQDAIEAFRLDWEDIELYTRDGAYNMCIQASAEFLGTLEEHGVAGTVEEFNPENPTDVAEYPFPLEECWCHWVVRVGDIVIDWTARQFDAEAPFPAVWRGPLREHRLE